MTSRERVVAALKHREPDRVPVDIGGGSSTSISVEANEALKRHLGVEGRSGELSTLFRVAALDEKVMLRLGSDCRPLRLKSPQRWSPPPSEPGTCVDIWGVTRKLQKYGENGYYWEIVCNPLADATVEDLDHYAWPDPFDPGFTAGLRAEAEALFKNTEYAVEASCGFSSFWEQASYLRGLEQLLMDLLVNRRFVEALMDKLAELNFALTERFLKEAGEFIQVFRTNDDLATQSGLMMSPDTYRSRLKPYHKRYYDFVKSRTSAAIVYHSCGNIIDVIDDLAETGVDAINPVQVSAMPDTAKLKAQFGGKITFWGGIDTQRVLPFGSVDDVAAEVRRRIRDLAPGGGFVLTAVHCIQPDVPPENILAMADAAKKYGGYPIRC
jgi:uroporphyrinogen decarboxylase